LSHQDPSARYQSTVDVRYVKHKGNTTMPRRKFSRVGIGELDRRSREARYMRKIEDDLLDHVGPDPAVTQRMLIGRAAQAMLRLAQIDERMSAGSKLSAEDSRVYAMLSNTLRLTLRELGIKGNGKAAPKAPRIEDIAKRYAAK
jgi:hypothetical protein